MQTAIAEATLQERDVSVQERIFRNCVHCGFCNATCPTYQLNGTELEGPRGRIYLMKSVLEGRIPLNEQVVAHLDNCLSCFSCETTCPSGVRYSHLIDPMRSRIEEQFQRPAVSRLQRAVLARLLPYPGRFRLAMRLAQLARPLAWLVPRSLRAPLEMTPARLPAPSALTRYEVHAAQGVRKARVALLTGCAQSVLGPHINDATIRVLTRLGAEVVLPRDVGCCGALVYHLGDRPGSLPHMQANIAAWHAEMQSGGLDKIVINTSGCGTVVKDYGHIFRDDPEWAERAAAVSAITADISEVATELGLPDEVRAPESLRVAYHDACSLQHGQKLKAPPRELLRSAGFTVAELPDAHLCCGSAGTYNLLKPATAGDLGRLKAGAIATTNAQVVAMGNIGCMEQIARYSDVPVVHTAELLDWALGGPMPQALRAGHGK
ncbi:MAG TPA: glycolate oxidase subunit GlcF [bacterium]|nr:glycolate oxidase subunit GlcF [bacterium]